MTSHVESSIDRYFSGKIVTAPELSALFDHAQRCLECRRAFDAQARRTRPLAGGERLVPDSDLALLAPALFDGVPESIEARAPLRGWGWLASAISAVACAGLLVPFLLSSEPGAPGSTAADRYPPEGHYRAKGGGAAPPAATVEVLCFDAHANLVAHLESSGSCPAPGFLKFVFASPRSVPHLSVAVFDSEAGPSAESPADDRVRLRLDVDAPEPRSVLSEHVRLQPGDVLRVVTAGDPGPLTSRNLAERAPLLVVTGVADGTARGSK